MYTTDQYEGMLAETVSVRGANEDRVLAYMARPLGDGPFPGMVLIHHMPGWDEWYREATRRFAHHGFVAISPNLYERVGHGSPEDVAAAARAGGGVPDDQAVADLEAAMRYLRALPYINGKVGVFGTCSGGRQAVLAASRVAGFDAVVDCWGGGVVMQPDQITPQRPVAPIDYTADLSCPVLGLFGAEDHSPTTEEVALHEEALKQNGKDYEFHMYDGAGHGFFYYNRPNYRQAQAVDGWEKIWTFLGRELAE
ncbi:MAG: dienelactone hydrolase family protein [Caldilineaceae bacterium]|nr:dienelactone hydrolase family protein [Caldilineaceae bacterium]